MVYQYDNVVFKEGDNNDYIYMLEDGSVEISKIKYFS